jgi:hypothetical protein
MKPLILTSCLIREFIKSGFADLAVDFFFRFVRGPLPPLDELATIYLGARIFDYGHGRHWSDYASRWGRTKNKSRRDLGLAEFCLQYETVELWFDADPNTQLLLVWLLDHFRSHPETIAKLKLRLVDREMTELDRLDDWQPPAVDVTERELATASATWQAYQAATPEACFELLGQDLSALPLFRPALIDLLQELPSSSTGLGATEMRMLELISEGNARPPDVFPGHEKRNKQRVFGYWETGSLLDGLARCPAPVVSGLDEGPFTSEMHDDRDRYARYKQTRLSLTELGQAVLACRDDFSRHNPIHRWWGGTELTNDRLWRWDPAKQALVAP